MVCLPSPLYNEPIDDDIVDKAPLLYPNHTVFTHMFCIGIRVLSGVALINMNIAPNSKDCDALALSKQQRKKRVILLIAIVLLLFGFKFFNNMIGGTNLIWKTYLRMLVGYVTALYLVLKNRTDLAGILMISDAMMAIQSRHLASTLTCGLKK